MHLSRLIRRLSSEATSRRRIDFARFRLRVDRWTLTLLEP